LIPDKKNLEVLKIVRDKFVIGPVLELMIKERWVGKRIMHEYMQGLRK
jgi:hypothetical protein